MLSIIIVIIIQELGIGTGNLALSLINSVKSIHGIDTSEGMLNVLKNKIELNKVTDKITYENTLLKEESMK